MMTIAVTSRGEKRREEGRERIESEREREREQWWRIQEVLVMISGVMQEGECYRE